MPTIDELVTTFINDLAPSAIQLILLLMALVGSYNIALALYQLYRNLSADAYQSTGQLQPVGGSMIRMLLGGLMVTPSVTLWRAADAFLRGGGRTASDVLSYIDGGGGATVYCQNFGDMIQLIFMVVGLIGIFQGYRHADDQARGLNPTGYRTAVVYLFGGLACFMINDLVAIGGRTFDMNWGFDQLCAAFEGG